MNATMEAIYNDMTARPDFYDEQWGFDPLRYLRMSTDEEGRTELSLDVKYRKHWFRLKYPQGKISIKEKIITDTSATFTMRVFADKADPEECHLAEGTAIRFKGTDKAFEQYYVDWAETIALGRALTNAGFDVPCCNIPGGMINPHTGELTEDQKESTVPPHAYSESTAPPLEMVQPETATPKKPVAESQEQPTAAPVEPRNYEEALGTLTLEQAKAIPVTFGKNSGQSLGQIAVSNPKDLDWIANKYGGNDFRLKAGAKILLDAALKRAG